MRLEDKDLQAIHNRLDELEKLIKTVKGEGISYKINIEHAEFNSPIVEHLDYHFDKLDVKEVSGALNLGNNFGVRVGQAVKNPEKKEDSKEDGESKKPTTEHQLRKEDLPPKSTLTKESELEKKSTLQEHQIQDSDPLNPKTPPPEDRPQMKRQEPTRFGGGRQTEERQSSPPKKTSFTEKRFYKKPSTNHNASDKSTFSKDSGVPPFKISFFPRGQTEREQP